MLFINATVMPRLDLRYHYSWFTLGYSDCIMGNINACNINNDQYKYTSINEQYKYTSINK